MCRFETDKAYTSLVEIFRTDVQNAMQAGEMIDIIHHKYPGHKINFDLEDCDNIFRIEGAQFAPEAIVSAFDEQGYQCKLLS